MTAPEPSRVSRSRHPGGRPHRVAVLLRAGAVPLNVAIPLEAFLRANELGLPYDVRLCGDRAQLGAFGSWSPDESFAWADAAETIVVPGRYDVAADADEQVLELIRRAADRGARGASTCGGAFVLAQAGILDGRRATSHWYRAEELRRRHPRVQVDPRPLYVEDGLVVTGAGMAAGLDLCVHLIRSDHGADAAARLARVLLVAPHREGGQAQFIKHPVPRRDGDGRLSDLRAWLGENLHRPVSLADMAQRAHCSERTLLRQFRAETGSPPSKGCGPNESTPLARCSRRPATPSRRSHATPGWGPARTSATISGNASGWVRGPTGAAIRTRRRARHRPAQPPRDDRHAALQHCPARTHPLLQPLP